MNRSTTTIRSISSTNGASRGLGRAGRAYAGGPSRRSANRTVLRATPNSAAIALIDLPCACKNRIVVHPATVSISFRVLLGATCAKGDAHRRRGQFSGEKRVSFQAISTAWPTTRTTAVDCFVEQEGPGRGIVVLEDGDGARPGH